ncbi:MAG: aminomethyl-transferring glycine dehydrogenase subunit GcvPA [Sulfobacillus sp.]|nr:aminomethyl-transferring glycine dehydrogenase subunit GcvPA [Sulfobacillus sp.]
MAYIPDTPEDRAHMLAALGIDAVDALFEDLPPSVRLNRLLDVPPALSEGELARHLRQLAAQNRDLGQLTSFLGGGFYDRYVPAAVGALAQRGEFLTAYTPYQPEVSQGTLAAIFEFQSMIQTLTGTDASQASLYDGASAVGEACLMALANAPKRHRLLFGRTVLSQARQVAETYSRARGAEITVIDGVDDIAGDDVAAVIWQYPDLLGQITALPAIIEKTHAIGAVAIVVTDPVALALLTPPGEFGADIVVGEGQPLGNRLQLGGPTFGFMGVKAPWIRKMPGRIVGATVDHAGRRGFVLTLQAREQHIRREKATSNICSNHSLNALMATIYLSLLGPEGLKSVATVSAELAHYLADRLASAGLVRVPRQEPFLYEFTVQVPGSVADLNRYLLDRGILGGRDLGQEDPAWHGLWQLAVTEQRTKDDCDRLVEEVLAWQSR